MENKKSIILIVDDNQENVRVLAESIKIPNVEISVALSGADALDYIGQELPDLILLDIMMPEMDGFEVCRILKSDVRTEHIPIIFLSALNSPESIVKGLELGGADYLLKPFNIAEINARLKTHLKIRKTHEYAINLLRDFAGSIPDINLIVDENGAVVEAFSLHEAMLDEIGEDSIVGRRLRDLLPEKGAAIEKQLCGVLLKNKYTMFDEPLRFSGIDYIFQFIIAPMGNTMNDKKIMSFHALDVTQSRYNEKQMSMLHEYNRKNLFFNNLLSGEYDCEEQNQLLRSYRIDKDKRYMCCAFVYEACEGQADYPAVLRWLADHGYQWLWQGKKGVMVLIELSEADDMASEVRGLKEKMQAAFKQGVFKIGAAELPGHKFNLSLLSAWAEVALLNAAREEKDIFIAYTHNKMAD